MDLAHKQRSAMTRQDTRYLSVTVSCLQQRLERHRLGSVEVEDGELLSAEIVEIALKKLQEYAK